VGVDPTADSFHLGSLIPVMGLAHVQRNGHIGHWYSWAVALG
jgi:tyrosyl-tRNA synthetase